MTGRTLIAVHGVGADRRCFEHQAAALEDAGHRLVTFDLPSHGANLGEPAEPGDALKKLVSVVTSQTTPVVLLGHSLGGFLSMVYTLDQPDLVDGLILVSTGPGFRNPVTRDAYNARLSRMIAKLGMRPDAINVVGQVDSKVIDGLGQITVPILQFIGSEDKEYLAGANVIARNVRDVRTVVVPGAGHNPQQSHADAVTSEILEFLAS